MFQQEIYDNYIDPSHPTAYSAPGAVDRFYKGKYHEDDILRTLRQIDSYTIHKESKRPNPRNPYYVFSRREQLQIDLIDMRKYAESNNGVKYLLSTIDSFTKKAFVEPLQNKTAQSTISGMEEIFDKMIEKPFSLFADHGSEFINNRIRTFFQQNNVKQYHAFSDQKAGIVERFNKTIQVMIYKYMTQNETNVYIDVLQDLVSAYNSRGHRTLKFISPNEADLIENHNQILKIHIDRYDKIEKKRKKPKHKLGDTVRIRVLPYKFERAYSELYKKEYFEIVDIKNEMSIPMYILKSKNTSEVIKGGFYSNELSKIEGEIFKISEVLRRRGKGKNRQLFVKWRDFDDSHNQWIKASDVVQVYGKKSKRKK